MTARFKAPSCGRRLLVAKTCPVCNEFKLADQFPKERGGHSRSMYWSPYCKACHGKASCRTARRTNAESMDKATHQGEEWSPAELDLLWELEGQGLSNRRIGERLGRSESSISVMKAKTRVIKDPIFLCYYEEGSGKMRVVGNAWDLSIRGHESRLNNTAQKMVKMQPEMIIFLSTEEEVIAWESEESTR